LYNFLADSVKLVFLFTITRGKATMNVNLLLVVRDCDKCSWFPVIHSNIFAACDQCYHWNRKHSGEGENESYNRKQRKEKLTEQILWKEIVY
jgi:hypothetical protein